MDDKLLFVIGAPRSGTTLLARMLGSHSAIYNRPEPHLLTPLAHLGYYATVQKAPYDPFNVAEAIRGFVADLPRKEADYFDACRAYTDVLYGRMLATSGKTLFLDKTPAYALVLDFITRLYPRAKYVVLTRHPVAIFSSFAASFFDDDYGVAQNHNPILNRYVPAIARFLRQRPAPLAHVRYEEMVREPASTMERICAFLGVPFEPGMIEYGRHAHDDSGLGDPLGVKRHDRPVTASIEKWTEDLAGNAAKLDFVRKIIVSLDPDDLLVWGYPQPEILEALARARDGRPRGATAPAFDRYRLQRKLLVMLRRNIHNNALGRLLKRVRFYLDVILRE
jgi:hypothetical protein